MTMKANLKSKWQTHLSFEELPESTSEVLEVVTHARVVCEGEEGVGVTRGRHWTQPCLPTLLVPVYELQLRSESTKCKCTQFTSTTVLKNKDTSFMTSLCLYTHTCRCFGVYRRDVHHLRVPWVHKPGTFLALVRTWSADDPLRTHH